MRIVDDTTGKYTDDQKTQAFREREARDDAVMIPAFQKILVSGDDATLWRSFIGLLNTLSPAEQNSPRYKGTRQEAMVGIAAGIGPNPLSSGPADLETIAFDSEKPSTGSSSQAAAKAANRWQDFLQGYNQTTVNSALLTKTVSTMSADLPSTNSVPTSSGPPANSTTVASTSTRRNDERSSRQSRRYQSVKPSISQRQAGDAHLL